METQTQRHRDTETQRHRDTETQRHRDTETQRHRDTETQRHTHTRPWFHERLVYWQSAQIHGIELVLQFVWIIIAKSVEVEKGRASNQFGGSNLGTYRLRWTWKAPRESPRIPAPSASPLVRLSEVCVFLLEVRGLMLSKGV